MYITNSEFSKSNLHHYTDFENEWYRINEIVFQCTIQMSVIIINVIYQLKDFQKLINHVHEKPVMV